MVVQHCYSSATTPRTLTASNESYKLELLARIVAPPIMSPSHEICHFLRLPTELITDILEKCMQSLDLEEVVDFYCGVNGQRHRIAIGIMNYEDCLDAKRASELRAYELDRKFWTVVRAKDRRCCSEVSIETRKVSRRDSQGVSEAADASRLQALGAHLRVELDVLTLGELAVAGGLDRGEVGEHVSRTVVRLDESETLFRVEPFHGTCCHNLCILIFI